jgi:hypothetical protein
MEYTETTKLEPDDHDVFGSHYLYNQGNITVLDEGTSTAKRSIYLHPEENQAENP